MRIWFQDPVRMELRGTPQGRGMSFGISIACALVLVGTLFAAVILRSGRPRIELVGVGVFILFGLFLLGSIVWIAFRRESLSLDLQELTGRHTVRHLISRRASHTQFPLARVHAVAVERSSQASGGGRGFATEVFRARLLLVKPRAAIDLDEVQGGDPGPIHALASSVAGFLGVEVIALDSGRERRRRAGDSREPPDAVMGPDDSRHAARPDDGKG